MCKFKVGDRVRFNDHSTIGPWELNYGVEIGGIYKVVVTKNDWMIGILGDRGETVYTQDIQIVKITGKESTLEKLLLWRNYDGS